MDNGPPAPDSHIFPPGFLWGVATASHQVEGDCTNNQWSQWEQQGRIKSRDQVGLACDWWRNAERDFDLAKSLGVNALRLSVEWSRIEPHPGVFDDKALERYRAMLLALRERNIRPFVTLHHFTNPLWFEQQGAFESPASVPLFERFTRHVVSELKDLCSDWCTFNEPNVYVSLGYFLGEFPPGRKGRVLQAARVTRHLLLAHAAAYRTIHQLQPHASVGWAQHYVVFKPRKTESNIDIWLAGFMDRRFNDNFAASVLDGRAPFPLSELGDRLPQVQGTCDYMGINYYSRLRAGFNLRSPRTLFFQLTVPPHKPQGDSGIEAPYGEAYPEGLRRAVEHFRSFNKPVYILENGVPDRADRIRPWVIQSSVDQLKSLLREGVDLRGYFHWSLTDNFEWNEGWHLRFGLVELDPITQERKPRPSAQLYSELIRQSRNGHGR